jgi:hypothetical protein
LQLWIAAPTVPRADPINLTYFCVDVDLLQDQANFFFYVKHNLSYLNHPGLVEPIAIG